MTKEEERYIAKRKRKAFFYGLAYSLCQVFPIKRNKIVFWAFEGTRGYCCCPKYIADEILRRSKNQYELVWLVQDENNEFPQGITKVKDTVWNRAYHLSTAAVWVGNSRTFFGTKKRQGQTYIQTWHGTIAIKPIGRYRGNLFPKIAEIVSQADSELIDYVLSGSDWCDKHYRDGLLYDGEIIRTGMPRCDILIEENVEIKRAVREKYNIPNGAKVLMYAPTFRGGSQGAQRSISNQEATIDFDALIEALEKKFGGQWYILLRLHPQMAAKNAYCRIDSNSERLKDATQHLDMNELIATVDGFVTDYSSAIFEAMLRNIPCFIYADDLEEYIQDRGDLFFDIKELPFSVATRSDELIDNVQAFEERGYKKDVEHFMQQQGIVEDGKASERVVNLIEKLVDNHK